MRHLIYGAHTERCENQRKSAIESGNKFRLQMANLCTYNTKEAVVFFNNELMLFEYSPCLQEGFSDNEFILSILENLLLDVSIKDNPYEISKSHQLDNDFKNYRNHGIALKKYLPEVNYIYEDTVSNKYAIVTESFLLKDKIINNDLLKSEFKKFSDYLEKNFESRQRIDFFLSQANELIKYNTINISNKEIVLTTSQLIKTLNKKIKTHEAS